MFPAERTTKLISVCIFLFIIRNVYTLPAESSDPAPDDGSLSDDRVAGPSQRVNMCPNHTAGEVEADCVENMFIYVLRRGFSLDMAAEALRNATINETDNFDILEIIEELNLLFIDTTENITLMLADNTDFDNMITNIIQDRIATVTNEGVLNPGVDRTDQKNLPLDKTFNPNGNGLDVPVYIVDTGIRLSHKQFQGRAFSFYIWPHFKQGDEKNEFSPLEGDIDFHGTAVASNAAGKDFGVARRAKIFNVRVYGLMTKTAKKISGSWITICCGLIAIRKNGQPGIINISSSVSGVDEKVRELFRDLIDILKELGFLVVVSAGNAAKDNPVDVLYNACGTLFSSLDNVMSVGATEIKGDKDVRIGFSKVGVCVDIYAVGFDVLVALETSDTACGISCGTSFSSPIVAGAAALIMRNQPDLTPEQIFDLLIARATPDIVDEVPDADNNNRLLFIPPKVSDPGEEREGVVEALAVCDPIQFPVQLDGDRCENVPLDGDLACPEGAFCQMTSDNPNDADFVVKCCNPCASATPPAGFCRIHQKVYDCAFGFTCTPPTDASAHRGVCCPGFSTGFPCPFDGVAQPVANEPFCLPGSGGTCGLEGYFCSPLSGRCCPDLFLFGGVPGVKGNPCQIGRPFVPPITCNNHYDCPAFSGWQFCQPIETDKSFGVYGICCDVSVHADAYKPNPCPLGFPLDAPANCSGNVDCPDDFFCTPLDSYYKPEECVCCPKITAVFDNPCEMGEPLENVICQHDTDCPRESDGSRIRVCTNFPGREFGACCLSDTPILATTPSYFHNSYY